MYHFDSLHAHRFGADTKRLTSRVDCSNLDVVAALYVSDPSHFEIQREDENLEVTVAANGEVKDITGAVQTLLFLRSLQVGDRVAAEVEGEIRFGRIESVEEGVELPLIEVDLGSLFASAWDAVTLKMDDGAEREVQAYELRPLPPPPAPGKRIVTVARTSTRWLDVAVDDALSDDEAVQQALARAGDLDFTQGRSSDGTYEIESVTRSP